MAWKWKSWPRSRRWPSFEFTTGRGAASFPTQTVPRPPADPYAAHGLWAGYWVKVMGRGWQSMGNGARSAKGSVHDSWCSVLSARSSVLGPQCSVLSARCSVLSPQSSVPGDQSSVLSARCSVLSPRCSVLGWQGNWQGCAVGRQLAGPIRRCRIEEVRGTFAGPIPGAAPLKPIRFAYNARVDHVGLGCHVHIYWALAQHRSESGLG